MTQLLNFMKLFLELQYFPDKAINLPYSDKTEMGGICLCDSAPDRCYQESITKAALLLDDLGIIQS